MPRRSHLERDLRRILAEHPEPGHCCYEYSDCCSGCAYAELRIMLGIPVDPYERQLLAENCDYPNKNG